MDEGKIMKLSNELIEAYELGYNYKQYVNICPPYILVSEAEYKEICKCLKEMEDD